MTEAVKGIDEYLARAARPLGVLAVLACVASCAGAPAARPGDADASPRSNSPTPSAAASSAPAPWGDRRSMASRVELHPIRTLTLNDAQFLRGDRAGASDATVAGELRLAQGQGRLPVVVLVHGSGGVGPNVEAWSRSFNAMGVSTFAIDGFTGRGLVSTSTDQKRLGRLNLIVDAYRALDVLARHPRVDPSRIVLMGFSRGGQAALFASVARFDRTWNTSGIHYAAHVSLYPDCMTTYRDDTALRPVPVRIWHGEPDDYNPIAPCRAYVDRLRAAGNDVSLTAFPNAHHGFDNPFASAAPTVARDAQTVRACRIRESAPGLLVNEATGREFVYGDACVQRDPHVNHDEGATLAAHREVREFVGGVIAGRVSAGR